MAVKEISDVLQTLEQDDSPQAVDFIVQNFEKQLPTILSNIEQIKQWAVTQTAHDRQLVLQSDEDFEKGRNRCAEINKQIQLIEAKRKDVKKAYNKPYEIFEKSLKEVVNILQSARENLWRQVTEEEEKFKAKKQELYRDYFLKQGCEWLTWEDVFDKRWLNKGTAAATVYKEIESAIKKAEQEVSAIKELKSEFEIALLEKYKRSHSLGETLLYNSTLASLSGKYGEVAEKSSMRTDENKNGVNSLTTAQNSNEEVEWSGDEELITVDFRVECSGNQLRELGNYMREKGIKYGKVPKGE